MNALAPARVGWCPGVLRPMASGDGLIVRVKPRGATLNLAQARGLADAALRFGNGALDLTGRGNVQIRGVTASTHAPLVAALTRIGLVDAEGEGARNLVSSPLAGLDSTMFDIRPAVAALETALARDPVFRALPAKFGFVVDDGAAALRDVAADIRFVVREGQGSRWARRAWKRRLPPPPRGTRSPSPAARVRKGGLPPPRSAGGRSRDAWWRGRSRAALLPITCARAARFRVRLGGDADHSVRCVAEDVPATAAALAAAFLRARDRNPDLHRMRDLVRQVGAVAVFRRSGFVARRCRRAPRRRLAEGAGVVRRGATFVVAAAAPFGRLAAERLLALAEAAALSGASELRVAPSRALLVPVADRAAAAGLAKAASRMGFIVDADDPRLRVAACVGAPSCHRATTPVLDHAARVAARLPPGGRGLAVHVSGCAKGCAHERAAPLTLVGRDGSYDLVANGRASSLPAAERLDFEAALRRVAPCGPGATP